VALPRPRLEDQPDFAAQVQRLKELLASPR